MNKILMLAACGSMACLFAAPADAGGDPRSPAPLLDGAAPSPAAAAGDNAAPTEPAAPAAPAASPPAEAPAAANPRTQARVTAKPKAAKSGARPRKPASATKSAARSDAIAAIVLQTSRVTGDNGRALPRRSVVLTQTGRADELIGRGWARPATDDEARTATIVLD